MHSHTCSFTSRKDIYMSTFYCEVFGVNARPLKFQLTFTRHLWLRYCLFNKTNQENHSISVTDFTPREQRRIFAALKRECQRTGMVFTVESIDNVLLRYTSDARQTLSHAISSKQVRQRATNRRNSKGQRFVFVDRVTHQN